MEGLIIRALAGFYYVRNTEDRVISCRARGKFRKDGISPLVGDRVSVLMAEDGATGTVQMIHPRKNVFVRPPVANIDCMIILAAGVNPITAPFLIDRICAIAASKDCEVVICINKCDLHRGDNLFSLYTQAGFLTIRTSAVTGEGIETLRGAIAGKICAFVGNSGVGKSSVLNALEPGFTIKTAAVSEKLGRGRHTTRHVELFELSEGTQIADTPGFSSFDLDKMELTVKEELQYAFRDFLPYIDQCRFRDCAHVSEMGCAVLEALQAGEIQPSRHESYVRLYKQVKEMKAWERKSE